MIDFVVNIKARAAHTPILFRHSNNRIRRRRTALNRDRYDRIRPGSTASRKHSQREDR
ncbi:MAG: hypothetical protein WBW31_01150 [Candidatus Sulfotelmatobacter sp.]